MNVKKIGAALAATVVAAGSMSYFPSSVFQKTEAMDTMLVSDNFDTTYDGWMNLGEQTLLYADESVAHDSLRSMHVSGRTSSKDGAASQKGLYLDGGKEYDYSVFVYHDHDAAETFTMKLDYLCEDGITRGSCLLAEETIKSGEWTEVTASCKAPKGATDLTVSLVTDTTNDFYFDDFNVQGKVIKDYSTVSAAGTGLKDRYANYFRVGSVLNGNTVRDSTITANILKEFNSITFENELKPDATMSKSSSSGTNIGVSLNSAASILDFCAKNGIGVRGHTLVWHSQTPQWVFKENFSDSGNWVSKSVMNQRMESYIKNMFGAIKQQYPTLNLYAYDVCNECVSDDQSRTANNGGSRVPGYGNGASPWVQIYGDNSFVEQAFTYARKYAPSTCKLFYNDYNEYWDHKRDCIYNMCKSLYSKGLLDGVGMQSHINADASGFSGTSAYVTAMKKFASIGCEVQVTELDISIEGGKYSLETQASKYKDVFQAAVDVNKSSTGGKVTAVCVWGPNDANTWIKTENAPLIYDTNNQPKPAYYSIAGVVPQSEWGDGNNPITGGSTPATPVEPDANGYYLHDTFESGAGDWVSRGGCTTAVSSTMAYAGSKSLYVSDRTAAWNGATMPISSYTFKPGESYSFSVCVGYNEGSSQESFNLTLEYTDSSDETQYIHLDTKKAANGEFVLLSNTNYKIPSDASDMKLVVETLDNDTLNFYMDEMIIAKAGTVIEGPSELTLMRGDVCPDGKIDILDMIYMKSGILSGFKSTVAQSNADVDKSRKVDSSDAIALKQYLLGMITEFPVAPVTIDTEKFDAMFAGTKLAEAWKKDGENNTLWTQRFGADPGWMVYNDRLYVYTTNDAFEYSNGQIQENSYNVRTINCFSSADLVNWTDHGAIPVAGNGAGAAPSGTQWASNWASRSWAPDAAWKKINGKDKFFLYFANNGSGVGVLTADSPTGPFTDPLGHELISGRTPNCSTVTWLFDPGVYYDETTGKGYLAFGGGVPSGQAANPGTGRIVQLGDDMISIVGTPKALNAPYLFEDSSLIKIGSQWVYSFCHNWNVPGGTSVNGQSFSNADIGYMTATDPLGTFDYKGVVFKNTGTQRLDNGGNNHHSIIYFKNQYYVLYHTRVIEIRMGVNNGKGQNYRSCAMDKATVSGDSIKCNGTLQGVSQLETLDPYVKNQAETMQNQAGINVRGVGDTVVTDTHNGDWIRLTGVKFDKGASTITARVGSKKAGAIKVCTSKNGEAVAYIDVPAGDLQEVEVPVFGELNGTTDLYFEFTEGVEFDWWQFS